MISLSSAVRMLILLAMCWDNSLPTAWDVLTVNKNTLIILRSILMQRRWGLLAPHVVSLSSPYITHSHGLSSPPCSPCFKHSAFCSLKGSRLLAQGSLAFSSLQLFTHFDAPSRVLWSYSRLSIALITFVTKLLCHLFILWVSDSLGSLGEQGTCLPCSSNLCM